MSGDAPAGGGGSPERQRWEAVDGYIARMLVGEDAALAAALRESAAAGLPPIAVSPAQGKLLRLLVMIHGAQRILEVGTLGGYSTIWLAGALGPAGRLLTLEVEPSYARVAGENIARAGLSEQVEQRVGPALEAMQGLLAEGAGPFELIFIDADKPTTPDYFRLALELSRPGGVIITDNVVRDGALADDASEDAGVLGMRGLHELIAAEPRVNATTIQTVGSKGYDGFTLALIE